MKNNVDLNSDMGECFGPWIIGDGVDDEIMPLISSCNIAAGFHASDPNIMHHSVKHAIKNNVEIGVHPGFRDLVGFGRRLIIAKPEELVNDCIYQLGALREFVNIEGGKMHHFKPHGYLYIHASKDRNFSYQLISALQKIDKNLPIYCMQGTITYEVAKELKQPYVREFYGDRDYGDDGQLVMVRRARAYTPDEVAQKVLQACKEGTVQTVTGKTIEVDFDSVCIHSDTAGALELIRATRKLLEENGITIQKPIIHQ
ncbi:5-oxoprolinase subunit PxpA [Helicobacter sp.]|uniref:5-oxoprolinase subunit PxpA n=1 Tax=Helicobacter sp. TaxID=218 RepID=UPI0025BD1F76|nr:5-oxoprolinase subunit PxpA [Helicobacter sp.]MCI5968472.1 5-oxoprolinase subunit PxpA [Helicobacter sp.]MDY2585257.1 5-oxoprolinase subunit PxpA [Helicobacter sp.]